MDTIDALLGELHNTPKMASGTWQSQVATRQSSAPHSASSAIPPKPAWYYEGLEELEDGVRRFFVDYADITPHAVVSHIEKTVSVCPRHRAQSIDSVVSARKPTTSIRTHVLAHTVSCTIRWRTILCIQHCLSR